jgi:hypothetical protein
VQLQLDIPENVSKHYQELLSIDQYPPCYQIIPSLTRLTVHSWMSALQTERLSQKTDAIEARVKQCNGDWENAYFVTLARNYGFGINGDAFEQWAYHLPLRAVDHHRDDLFQIEAIIYALFLPSFMPIASVSASRERFSDSEEGLSDAEEELSDAEEPLSEAPSESVFLRRMMLLMTPSSIMVQSLKRVSCSMGSTGPEYCQSS